MRSPECSTSSPARKTSRPSMARPTTPGDRPGRPGYVLIMLTMAVFVITLGLLVAVPVWQTELQREKEEELIFRGRQYAQAVMVAPERVLAAIKNPQILGVVSSSTNRSVKIYNDQESHDKWLFFFGQDPKKLPKIVTYGEKRCTALRPHR